MIYQCSKVLTANDIGLTGGHQAGIHIPKSQELLGFFPPLNSRQLNPRARLIVCERDNGEYWEFNFVHYNNKLVAGGTRDEYRLTGMTGYMRAVSAEVNDRLVFQRDENSAVIIWCDRASALNESLEANRTRISLSGTWKVLKSR